MFPKFRKDFLGFRTQIKRGLKMIYVFLADGFEEIEGLTVVDLLRRAGVEVTTVSITEKLTIHGAHKIDVQADKLFDDEGINLLIQTPDLLDKM